jgi:xanthine dehydrogenase accessory factor
MMSVQERLSVAGRTKLASYRGAEKKRPPTALVLGTGDIASAIGRRLFLRGWRVLLLRDNGVPVLRRGMAFDDGIAALDGVIAVPALTAEALPHLLSVRAGVVVANLDLAVLTASDIDQPAVLVDARMRKYATPADLRPLAGCAVGVGPGFVAGGNVHIAIETLPGQEGGVVTQGPTAVPTGEAVPLGGAGAERFVYAPIAGAWQPDVPLGARLDAGAPIGRLGHQVVVAPMAGCVRGMVRAAPGGVARGSKLLEIDPRPEATCAGVPPRAQRIAAGVETALAALSPTNLDGVCA